MLYCFDEIFLSAEFEAMGGVDALKKNNKIYSASVIIMYLHLL
jgi:hypothetical protein